MTIAIKLTFRPDGTIETTHRGPCLAFVQFTSWQSSHTHQLRTENEQKKLRRRTQFFLFRYFSPSFPLRTLFDPLVKRLTAAHNSHRFTDCIQRTQLQLPDIAGTPPIIQCPSRVRVRLRFRIEWMTGRWSERTMYTINGWNMLGSPKTAMRTTHLANIHDFWLCLY